MTRFPASFPPKRLFRILTAALATLLVPGWVFAQAAEEETAYVSGERLTGRPDRELYIEGDVEVIRGPSTVYADRATYDIVEDEVHAVGNIRLLRGGDVYTGEELRLRIAAGQGFVSQPTYFLVRNEARGVAERVEFESRDRAIAFQGTYSTCEGPDPDWYLKSSRLALDRDRDQGTAYNTWVYFQGVPILAAPVLSFPLSDERKSGVLPPTFGTTNRGGFELTVPYYFNIAPNRDATIYPTLISRRGLQLGVEARYLEEDYFGQTYVEGLANDSLTGTNRYAISSTHTHRPAPRWTFSWNLNHASDDDYPTDFATTRTAASQRLLIRDLVLGYAGDLWNVTARTTSYEVLQDPAASITPPYDRLPHLSASAARSTDWFDWFANAEAGRFWHPTMVRGDRVVVNPGISYPILRPAYFVTPRLSVHASAYQLEGPGASGSRDLTRVLPTFSLDSGLVFERETQFLSEDGTQTLEPRLFYVYTPYEDQSAFPLFDTAEAAPSFAQFFSENRFVGQDRIADANHLTAGITSRFLDQDGAERVRLSVAQRYYLKPQRVSLGTPVNEGRSDILLGAYGRVTPTFSVSGDVQYSESLGAVRRANAGLQWIPKPLHVLNVLYRLDRAAAPRLEQVDVSAQWPFATRWYGVGRVNYSLPDSEIAEALLGLEYKADCWIFRMVAKQTPTSAVESTTSFFLQLELTGLTRIGSNPLEVLRTSIPGYQLVN